MSTDTSDFDGVTREQLLRMKALDAVRWLSALAASPTGSRQSAIAEYEQRYPLSLSRPAIAKAAVTPHTILPTAVTPEALSSAFRDLAERQSVYGRLQLPRVPFKVPIGRAVGDGTFAWVGEGQPKPITTQTYAADAALEPRKVAGTVVVADDLLRLSSPAASDTILRTLTRAYVRMLDESLLDPAVTGTPGVQPASLTAGALTATSQGATAAHIVGDLRRLADLYAGASTEHAVLIAHAGDWLAASISAPEAVAGVERRVRVVTSDWAPHALVLLDRSTCYAADDGAIDLSISRQASVEMRDESLTQDGAAGTGASLVSFWQAGLAGVRVERYLNWQAGAVAAITGVTYAVSGSPA